MNHRDLEQRLKGMRREGPTGALDRRMETLFDGADGGPVEAGLESRLGRMRRVPVPGTLDRRMAALFGKTGEAAPRPFWQHPAWAAAAVVIVVAVGFIIRGGPKPGHSVVNITPEGSLEQFLVGGPPTTTESRIGIFTRGGCTVETVWPADAPALDRRPVAGNGTGEGT